MNGYGSADRAGSNTQPRTSPGSAQLSVLSTVGAQLNTAPAACYVFTYISKNAKIPTASSGISTPLLYYGTLHGVVIGWSVNPYTFIKYEGLFREKGYSFREEWQGV